MLLGEFADIVTGRLDYTNTENLKTNRRNVLVMGDAIRNELLAAGNFSATQVNGQWQFNIGNDLKDLPGILFISKSTPVQLDCNRNKYYSILPGEVVTFKNKHGIRTVHGMWTNVAQQGANILLQSDRTDFVYQQTGASVAYGLLESASLTGTTGYEVESQNGTPGVIYFNNPPTTMPPNVLITYLPRLWNGGLGEDDMMPMDDTFTQRLIDLCVVAFTQQKVASRDKVEGQ